MKKLRFLLKSSKSLVQFYTFLIYIFNRNFRNSDIFACMSLSEILILIHMENNEYIVANFDCIGNFELPIEYFVCTFESNFE